MTTPEHERRRHDQQKDDRDRGEWPATERRRVPDNGTIYHELERINLRLDTLTSDVRDLRTGLRIGLNLDVSDPNSIRAMHTTQDMRALADQVVQRGVKWVVAMICSFLIAGLGIAVTNVYGPLLRDRMAPSTLERPLIGSSVVSEAEAGSLELQPEGLDE